MRAKLIKDDNLYGLKDGDKIIGTSDDELNSLLNYPFRLSIKNCQAIERGYDLEELAEETYPIFNLGLNATTAMHTLHQESFKEGFQKALELMCDKKFSEEDIEKAIVHHTYLVYNDGLPKPGDYFDDRINKVIQSLKQTEWDCIVEMEYIGKCNGNNGDGCFQESPGHNCGCFERNPKLDADGCLILKLKSE